MYRRQGRRWKTPVGFTHRIERHGEHGGHINVGGGEGGQRHGETVRSAMHDTNNFYEAGYKGQIFRKLFASCGGLRRGTDSWSSDRLSPHLKLFFFQRRGLKAVKVLDVLGDKRKAAGAEQEQEQGREL